MVTKQTAIRKIETEIGATRINREIRRRGKPRAPSAVEILPSVRHTPQAWTRVAMASKVMSKLKVELRVQVSTQCFIAVGTSNNS